MGVYTTLNKQESIELYRKMLEIRRFEEKVLELYTEALVAGPAHLYMGEEAVAVGVCANLRKDDYITSTHRGHGHCIAKGARLDRIMSELLGRETGYNKGRSGSMHMMVAELGILGCNSIVGAGIPIAVGIGLSAKLRRTDQVAVSFFGDGAANQGAFHEGINLAAIWKLPVIFVCENNLYAVSVPVSKSTSVKDIATRACAYGIPGVVVDGMDVMAVHQAAGQAVKRAREGQGPTLIECKVYRFRPHGEGETLKYRTEEEIQTWKNRCPVERFKARLMQMNVLTDEEAKQIEQEVIAAIESSVRFAKESAFPPSTIEEATKYVYA